MLIGVHPIIDELLLDPEKLGWGTDSQNFIRNRAHRLGMHYLANHRPFASNSEQQLLLSGNIARIFNINIQRFLDSAQKEQSMRKGVRVRANLGQVVLLFFNNLMGGVKNE